MNEEFAIEPAAFKPDTLNAGDVTSCLKDARHILEKFGFHEGRFISKLPGEWFKQVLTHIDSLPDGPSKEKIKLLIRKTKDRGGLVNSGISFDPDKSWLTNAITYEKIFAGIIVSNESACDRDMSKCKAVDEALEDKSFFGSCREVRMHASVEEFGIVATPLLRFSQEAYLIDPYFDFSNSKNMSVLKKFTCIGAKKCKRFVIYTSKEVKGIQEYLQQNFEGTETSIEVRYIEKNGSFHPRYLLTIHGGIRFDKGFRCDNEETHDVGTIDINMHDELCKEYIECKHGFKVSAKHSYPNIQVE